MESYLVSDLYDLVTPDGVITNLKQLSPSMLEATVFIEKISPVFVGFFIDKDRVFFNMKSVLAQLGINGVGKEYHLDFKNLSAQVKVAFQGFGELGPLMLSYLKVGAYVGKLFAADERRCVRNADYLLRMFGRVDREDRPLLLLGGRQGSEEMFLEKVDGRTVAYLSIQEGVLGYEDAIKGFLPTLAKALQKKDLRVRHLLELDQTWTPKAPRYVRQGEMLLIRTLPLHIRTVFGRVVDSLLPQGVHHTTASILDPTTKASGDIYELFGSSKEEIVDMPIEFYTLEPHREHVFFSDRDQLQMALENPALLFKVFDIPQGPNHYHCSVFVVKGEQLLNLKPSDWICRETRPIQFSSLIDPKYQAHQVEDYIHAQPEYPFLKSIEDGLITSQGVMFSRYFPSPLMKSMLLSDLVRRNLKRIYFQQPSFSCGNFFSHEDRSMLLDLARFDIGVYWVDKTSGKILQYIAKPEKDSGMFAPLEQTEEFRRATAFGMYGSNLQAGELEKEITALFQGLVAMRQETDHHLLNKNTPLALITGGGTGVMEMGNRIARNLNILSCANIVDFRSVADQVGEQTANPYIDIKMTYRLDRLIERQAEFNLDFPIFLAGGIGTDFEYSLEELRRKVMNTLPTPVLLFGSVDYFRRKITSRFQCNLETKTILGSEWVSNCFYCVQTAAQGLKIYRQFFNGTLAIGREAPMHKTGFVIVT